MPPGRRQKAHYSISRSAQYNVPRNAGLVARLHSCQLLHRLRKDDLAIKLGAGLLVDLLRTRSAHSSASASSITARPGDESESQILRIVESGEERGGQASAPLFLNMLCHAGLTVAMALHHKATRLLRTETLEVLDASGAHRPQAFALDSDGDAVLLFRKAEAIARAVSRQMTAEPDKVSPALVECAGQYRTLLQRESSRFASAINSAALRRNRLLCYWLSAVRHRLVPPPRLRVLPSLGREAAQTVGSRQSPARRPNSRGGGPGGGRDATGSPARIQAARGFSSSPVPRVEVQARYNKLPAVEIKALVLFPNTMFLYFTLRR